MDGFDFNFSIALVKSGSSDIGIVAENDDPLPRKHTGNPLTLGFERLERIEVVGHDPRQSNMVPRREQICNKGEGLFAAGDNHGLNVGVVTGNASHGDAGEDFRIAIDEVPEPFLGNGSEIFGEIAGTIAFGGIHGVFEFTTLDDVTGATKRGKDTVFYHAGIAATMIEVEMGVDDQIDLIGLDAGLCERVQKGIAVLNVVDGALLGIHLCTITGFNDDVFAMGANEQRIGAHADAVFLVGRRFFLPENFRDDAEH